MPRKFNKVFVIGLSKTGTSSLSKALEILGLSSIHYPSRLSMLKHYQSASDLPVAMAFKKLDKLYPQSLFILSTREMDSWLHSMQQHIAKMPLPAPGTKAYSLRVAAFGAVDFDRDQAMAGYIKHQKTVEDYFCQRREDLLLMQQPDDFNWAGLCDFLQIDIPERPFPKENQASSLSLQQLKKSS